MTGSMRSIYLTDETTKIADTIENLSKWMQIKLKQHQIEMSSPEKQTHHTKEKLRWDLLMDECMRYVNQAADIAHEHSIPRQPTRAVVENWARGYKHEIEILDLTPAQFVEKVLAREKDDNGRDHKTDESGH